MERAEELKLTAVIGFGGKVKNGLIYHPGGRYVLYPLGTTVVIKNILTGKQEFLQGHTDSISCIALSNDGKKLATGQKTHMGFVADVILWDLDSKALEARLALHKVFVEDVAFSSDDKYLASLGGRDDSRVIIWEVAKGKAIREERSNAATVVAWTPVGNSANDYDKYKLVTGGTGIVCWDVFGPNGGGKMVRKDAEMGGERRTIKNLAINPKGDLAYCGSATGDILIVTVKADQPKLLGKFSHPKVGGGAGVTSLVYCNDNGFQYLLAGDGKGRVTMVEVVDRAKLVCKRQVTLSGQISSISNGYDFKSGMDTFIGTFQGNQYILNSRTLDYELRGTSHHSGISDVCFPDGCSELFITTSTSDIRVWDAHKKQELLRIQVPNLKSFCACLDPMGSAIITGWEDGKVRAFMPQSGKLLYTITDAHQGAVTSLAVTSIEEDGSSYRLMTGGEDGRVRIWSCTPDPYTGKVATNMSDSKKEHKSRVTSIVLTGDDTEMVSSSTDGSCIVWDIERGVRSNAFFDSTMFKSVLYHPDESQLLTCGSDRKITYWDAAECNAIRVIEGGDAEINALCIEPDGILFVSAGADKLVKVWHYDDGILKAVGKGHSGNINRLKISPNQKSIVSVGEEGAILIWEMPAEGAADLRAGGYVPEAKARR